jgi:serine/threonine protein kinase
MQNKSQKVEEDSSSQAVNTHFSMRVHSQLFGGHSTPLSSDEPFADAVDSFMENIRTSTYAKQERLGEGGMGSVDRVKDPRSLRSIALKTLQKKNATEEEYVRFAEEAQITAQLEHPNIIPVYDLGTDEDGHLYYTMKMISGENLNTILKAIKKGDQQKIKAFPLTRLLDIFLAICDAMSYACSQNVIHRDLKPENIMVGDFGEIYLVDWGLAKVVKIQKGAPEIPSWITKGASVSRNLDAEKAIKELKKVKSFRETNKSLNISYNDILIGTPQYVSPERIHGDADERSEVYAFGAILYNILTLELTVSGENLEEILTKVINGDIKDPLSFRKELPHLNQKYVPAGLAAVAMKALSLYPQDRYQQVADLRKEISRWQDGYLTDAETTSSWKFLWAKVKRNKGETLAIVSFLILLVGIFTIYALNLKKEEKVANDARKLTLEQKANIDLETVKLKKNTLLFEAKIKELSLMAPELYRRSMTLFKSGKAEEALQTISAAIELLPLKRYKIVKANMFQTNGDFLKSLALYREILEEYPRELRIQESIRFSNEFANRPIIHHTEIIKFYNLLITQQRYFEAVIVQQQLFELGKNLRNKVLAKVKDTPLSFIQKSMVELTDNGYLKLNIRNRNIRDLSPLSGLPFVELDISFNPITDISALKGMPLESLKLEATGVRDISPLKGMNLRVLSLKNTPVSDLQSLDGQGIENLDIDHTAVSSFLDVILPSLRTLKASSTLLSDISFIPKSLSSLSIRSTNVADLSPLNGLNIRFLDISMTPVVDLAPLANLPITHLFLDSVAVEDFSVLSTLPLSDFSGNNTKFNNLDFIKSKSITYLSLENAWVKDISLLKGMPLIIINLSGTEVRDISALYGSPIDTLILKNTALTEFPVLKELTHLKSLIIPGTKIVKIGDIGEWDFERLDLSMTEIRDISGLKKASFSSLNLSQTAVVDISALSNKNLHSLNLSGTHIKSLDALRSSSIQELNVSSTSISNLEPLKNSKLKVLNVGATKVKNLHFKLLKKIRLEELDISKTSISHVDFIDFSAMKVLNASETKISDFKKFTEFTKLIEVDLSGSPVRSIRELLSQPLRVLNLGNCNNLGSLEGLDKLSATLRHLVIPDQIEDFSILKKMTQLLTLSKEGEASQTVDEFWQKYGVGSE